MIVKWGRLFRGEPVRNGGGKDWVMGSKYDQNILDMYGNSIMKPTKELLKQGERK
jgi:hypothetical protein